MSRKQPEPHLPSIGINISDVNGASKAGQVVDAIMQILGAPHSDQETKRLALEVLGNSTKSEPITLSNVSINMGGA
jgi:hypothetical protein